MRVPALPAQARERARVAQWPEAEHGIAARIAAGALLADPQELRPLPLAGIVGCVIGLKQLDSKEPDPEPAAGEEPSV